MSEGEAPASVDLSALGFYSADEAAEDAYARILVLGDPKIGKTTALLTTAPAPAIINCDGDSATKYAAELGASYHGIDVSRRNVIADWKRARSAAAKAVKAGAVRSIIVDSLTLLADNLLDAISLQFDGFDRFNELASQLVGGVKEILELPCHVFFVAHMTPEYGRDTGSSGMIPLIQGQAKVRIPALVHDPVWFDYQPGPPPKRQFLIGPQPNWTYGGRNVRRSCAVEPTVPALFRELGIAL